MLSAGFRLGSYDIIAPLGAGGMGEVYRARDTKLGRDVAIKVLPSSLVADAAALARFEREARAVAALSHPNIVAIHELAHEGDRMYAVMELLDGESLRDRLAQGPLPVRKAIEYAVAMARGLAAAHARGIVHRDLKPENVFVTRDGQIKILDFGLARVDSPMSSEAADKALTIATPSEPGMVLGTVGYMSPEQVRGANVDHRADVFALGTILYEMLSGRRAFARDSAPETMTAILKDDPPLASTVTQGVPAALDRVIAICLEKRPEDRFESARDLALALEMISTVSERQTPLVPAVSPPKRWRRLSPVVAALVITGFLSAVAGWRLAPREVASPAAVQFGITTGGVDSTLSSPPAISPDGRTVALIVMNGTLEGELLIRPIDSVAAHAVPGRPTGWSSLSWSGDSRFVSYPAIGNKLVRGPIDGGPSQMVFEFPALPGASGAAWGSYGIDWSKDGTFVLASGPLGIARLSASDWKTPVYVTKPDDGEGTLVRASLASVAP